MENIIVNIDEKDDSTTNIDFVTEIIVVSKYGRFNFDIKKVKVITVESEDTDLIK